MILGDRDPQALKEWSHSLKSYRSNHDVEQSQSRRLTRAVTLAEPSMNSNKVYPDLLPFLPSQQNLPRLYANIPLHPLRYNHEKAFDIITTDRFATSGSSPEDIDRSPAPLAMHAKKHLAIVREPHNPINGDKAVTQPFSGTIVRLPAIKRSTRQCTFERGKSEGIKGALADDAFDQQQMISVAQRSRVLENYRPPRNPININPQDLPPPAKSGKKNLIAPFEAYHQPFIQSPQAPISPSLLALDAKRAAAKKRYQVRYLVEEHCAHLNALAFRKQQSGFEPSKLGPKRCEVAALMKDGSFD